MIDLYKFLIVLKNIKEFNSPRTHPCLLYDFINHKGFLSLIVKGEKKGVKERIDEQRQLGGERKGE